jgi:hypothetical protein
MITMNIKPTELCNLGYKYGTDKCPQIKHAYTPFYYQLLKDRQRSIKKVLEIGIGRNRRNSHIPEVIYEKGIRQYLRGGASLYMWREFFPNAQIIGADIHPETIFEDDRIKTYLCDERKKIDLERLVENTGSDIDLVIDDASHHVDDQIFACQTLMPLLKKDVIYIIEDVSHTKLICKALSESGDYEFHVPEIPRKSYGNMLLVIRNEQHDTK